jgi:hypothetical protein
MANLDQTIQKETPKLFWLEGFEGVNLHDDRRAIGDQESSWMENMAPLGAGNLRAMYDNATPLYTAGQTIVFDFPFNIGANFYHALFLADGSALAVALAGGVSTIGAAGKFSVSPTLPDCAQWGASGIIIVTSAGYYAWDGVLYSPGDFAPSWLSGFTTLVTTGTTNGTTSVTAVASTAGLVTGMTVTSGTGDIPAGTLVQTFTSNSITLTQAATASNVGEAINVGWVMPSGVVGTAVEAYQQRAWVMSGAQFSFSAPSNGADFSTADGGGTTKSTDGFLKTKFVNLQQANSYLYLFGDGGINVISNVQTSGSPATTTMNNQNVDPQTGLGWRDALIPFGNSICIVNPTGVYQVYGGSATKISDKIDKLFEKANFSVVTPTLFVTSIFRVRCLGLIINTLDPTTNTQRTVMCLWNEQKWFIASQGLNTIFSTTFQKDATTQGWGHDGTNVYQMFQTASSTLAKKVQTKLWAGQSIMTFKTTMDIYQESYDLGNSGVVFSGTLDSDTNSPVAFSVNAFITWINNALLPITFVNNVSAPLQFVTSPSGVQGADGNQSGRRLGMTLTSMSPDFVLIGVGESYNEESYYGH